MRTKISLSRGSRTSPLKLDVDSPHVAHARLTAAFKKILALLVRPLILCLFLYLFFILLFFLILMPFLWIVEDRLS